MRVIGPPLARGLVRLSLGASPGVIPETPPRLDQSSAPSEGDERAAIGLIVILTLGVGTSETGVVTPAYLVLPPRELASQDVHVLAT